MPHKPDGYLWVSTGDGTLPGGPDPQCAAQAATSLDGKILRLDVDAGAEAPPHHAIPADNPFAGGGGGTKTGDERVYSRPLGESYEAVRDTAAFPTCP